jgi:hypothetical protein
MFAHACACGSLHLNKAVTKGAAHYAEWCDAYTSLGLVSNWGGASIDPVAARTTYNARTFVQPQLQKAVKKLSVCYLF